MVIKAHRDTVTAKEILAREQTLLQNEQQFRSLLHQKDKEITYLQRLVLRFRQEQHRLPGFAVKQAFSRQEEKLCVLVMKREEDVAVAIAQRDQEIMDAVRNREAQVDAACLRRGDLIRMMSVDHP